MRLRRKEQASAQHADQKGMDVLQFAEKVASEALHDARSSYDTMHERVHKLATWVAGGAGGAGVYALGKLDVPGTTNLVAALAALALWWFFIVGGLLLRGNSSRPMKAGTASSSVRARFVAHTSAGASEADALWNTRWEHLAAVDKQIEEYSTGTSARARTLDRAYACVACSPAIAFFAYLLAMLRA